MIINKAYNSATGIDRYCPNHVVDCDDIELKTFLKKEL
jgi:hypothetical protein